MLRNVASQKLTVFAFTPADGLPATGDAANLTAYVSIDNGALTVLGDTSGSEIDSTNAKGYYRFDLTAGETNGDKLEFTCKSATGGVVVICVPAVNQTVGIAATANAVDVASVSGDATAANNLEAMLDGTGGFRMTLQGIDIAPAAGTDGISIIATAGAGGNGIYIEADVAGILIDSGVEGISITSGSNAISLSSTNACINAVVLTSGHCFDLQAFGASSNAINLTPGSGGYGIAGTLTGLSVVRGTSDSGTTTTMVDAALTQADTDYFTGSLILFTSGTIAGQCRQITGFTPGTDTVTFSPAVTQAVGTQTYEILPSGGFLRPTTVGRALDVSTGGEAGLDWANVGTPGSTVSLSATTVATVTTATTATNVTTVNGLAAGVITAASIAADAITDAKVASDVTIASVTGAVGSVTGNVGGNVVGSVASVTNIPATGTGLTAIPWNASWDTEVQSEVQDAIEVNHLDHLLAADYDPASKPGVATALLNELVESDAGVSRYTANALEQAPAGGGGGGGATAAQVWEYAARTLTSGVTTVGLSLDLLSSGTAANQDLSAAYVTIATISPPATGASHYYLVIRLTDLASTHQIAGKKTQSSIDYKAQGVLYNATTSLEVVWEERMDSTTPAAIVKLIDLVAGSTAVDISWELFEVIGGTTETSADANLRLLTGNTPDSD